MNVVAAPTGGIIAAGEGSRLRQAGWTVPKPLVPVAGVPLIATAINNFRAAGILSVRIIVNEEEQDCVDWVRAHVTGVDVEFIVKTTASSLESFARVIARRHGPDRDVHGRRVVRGGGFHALRGGSAPAPADATVLAVTPLVDDEKPLWVEHGRRRARDGDRRRRGAMVTAGLYLVPGRCAARRSPPSSAACASTSRGSAARANRCTPRWWRRWWTWTAPRTWRSPSPWPRQGAPMSESTSWRQRRARGAAA